MLVPALLEPTLADWDSASAGQGCKSPALAAACALPARVLGCWPALGNQPAIPEGNQPSSPRGTSSPGGTRAEPAGQGQPARHARQRAPGARQGASGDAGQVEGTARAHPPSALRAHADKLSFCSLRPIHVTNSQLAF